MCLGHRARQLKSRNCLLASDRGKALEKLVERIPGFEVAEYSVPWLRPVVFPTSLNLRRISSDGIADRGG